MAENIKEDFFYPYRRTWEALKRNQTGFLNVGLVSLILRLTIYALSMVLLLPLIFILIFIYFSVMMITVFGTAISFIADSSGGGLIMILIMFIFMIVLMIILLLILVLNIVIQTLYLSESIYIGEKLSTAREGGKVNIGSAFNELRSRWKEIMRKGFLLTILYLGSILLLYMVLSPFMMVPFLNYIIIYGIVIFASPIFAYVIDVSILGIVRGDGVFDSFTNSIRSIFRNQKGVGYFYLLYITVMFASILLSPLSMIIGICLPIASKMLILENPDLFEY